MPAHLLASQFDALEEPNDIFTVNIEQTTEAILAEVITYLDDIGFADKTNDSSEARKIRDYREFTG
jgi:hypothetical protein